MKKKIGLIIAIFAIVVLVIIFLCPKEKDNSQKQITIGGSNPGGTAYIVGTAYAQIINKYVPEVNVTHEVTAGGKENVELTSSGETDLGCGMSAFLYEA